MPTIYDSKEFLYAHRDVLEEFLEDTDRGVLGIKYFQTICIETKKNLETEDNESVKQIEHDFEVEMPKLLMFLTLQIKVGYFLENKKDKYSPYKYTRAILIFYKMFYTRTKMGFHMIECYDEMVANGEMNEQEYIEHMNGAKHLKDLLDTDFCNTYINACYNQGRYQDDKCCVLIADKTKILSLLNQIKNIHEEEMAIVN